MSQPNGIQKERQVPLQVALIGHVTGVNIVALIKDAEQIGQTLAVKAEVKGREVVALIGDRQTAEEVIESLKRFSDILWPIQPAVENPPPQPREVTLQELLDHGLNGFALAVLVESFGRHPTGLKKPVTFQFRGYKFTVEPAPEEKDNGERTPSTAPAQHGP